MVQVRNPPSLELNLGHRILPMLTFRIGTMPGPVEMLQEARNGKLLLPPRSRSPIKTSLGSSPRRTPRRSVGPRSSSSQPTTKSTPTRAASHPLNYTPLGSQNEVTPTIELSAPNGQKSRPKKPKKISTNGKGVKRVFDLSLADDDDDDDENNDQDENQSSVLNGVDDSIGVMREDTGLLGNEDETNQVPLDEDIPEAENNQPFDVTVQVENVSGATEAIKGTITIPKRHAGRPPKVPPVNHDSLINPNGSESQIAPRKNRGRPPRKKQKNSKAAAAPKDLNIEMKPPPKPNNRSTLEELTSRQAYSRPNSRSTYTERHETPADNGARRTRAGRTIVGPVAFWRGERIVYGDGNIDGSILTLPGIKEIIRTEEVEIPRPHKRPVYRRSKPKRQPEDVEEKEEEVDEREPWETETGTVRAQVMQWDHMTGKYDEDNTEETGTSFLQAMPPRFDDESALTASVEVAYAAEAIEMRNISGAEFQFAKTLTLPFFGSGMVDLPPGGAKRVKNSRKMQMVFFVFYGRVTVDMGTPTSSFSIGKGGMWQVPRGKQSPGFTFALIFSMQFLHFLSCVIRNDLGSGLRFGTSAFGRRRSSNANRLCKRPKYTATTKCRVDSPTTERSRLFQNHLEHLPLRPLPSYISPPQVVQDILDRTLYPFISFRHRHFMSDLFIVLFSTRHLSASKANITPLRTGNFYSITNLSTTNKARIFFAQGCEVAQDMGYDESQAA